MVNLDGYLVVKCQLNPVWGIRQEFCLEIVKRHPLGSADIGLVAKWEGGVIGEVDGATLGEWVKWE